MRLKGKEKSYALIERVGQLPDEAILPDSVAAMLLGVSIWTLRRENPVAPVQVTPRCRGRRLGDIRRFGVRDTGVR